MAQKTELILIWHHTHTPNSAQHSPFSRNTIPSFQSSCAIPYDFLTILAKGALDKDHEVRQAAFLIIKDKLGIELSPDILGFNQTQSLIQGVVSRNTMEGFSP